MYVHNLPKASCSLSTSSCIYLFLFTDEEPPAPGSDSLKRKPSAPSLMDKIPDEAESLTVLVGGVKFLEKPVVAFVRLAQSRHLGDLTEVPIPARFIFLQLGPNHGEIDYHEVGRAMATLMSDAVSTGAKIN